MTYDEKIQEIRNLLKTKHIQLCEIKNIEDTLLKHIETHKYLINENIPFTVNFDEAIFSWLENVFNPMMLAINKTNLATYFPGIPATELFRRVQDHLYFLSIESGRVIYPDEAVVSFFRFNQPSKFKRLLFKVTNVL